MALDVTIVTKKFYILPYLLQLDRAFENMPTYLKPN